MLPQSMRVKRDSCVSQVRVPFENLREPVSEMGYNSGRTNNVPGSRVDVRPSYVEWNSTLFLPLSYEWNDLGVDIVADGLA